MRIHLLWAARRWRARWWWTRRWRTWRWLLLFFVTGFTKLVRALLCTSSVSTIKLVFRFLTLSSTHFLRTVVTPSCPRSWNKRRIITKCIRFGHHAPYQISGCVLFTRHSSIETTQSSTLDKYVQVSIFYRSSYILIKCCSL